MAGGTALDPFPFETIEDGRCNGYGRAGGQVLEDFALARARWAAGEAGRAESSGGCDRRAERLPRLSFLLLRMHLVSI